MCDGRSVCVCVKDRCDSATVNKNSGNIHVVWLPAQDSVTEGELFVPSLNLMIHTFTLFTALFLSTTHLMNFILRIFRRIKHKCISKQNCMFGSYVCRDMKVTHTDTHTHSDYMCAIVLVA